MNILVSLRCAPIALALLFACSTAISQDGTKAIPENAHAAYGSWDCNRGFVKKIDSCTPLEVPRNAHLGSWGTSWYCDRGYRKEEKSCVAVKVPHRCLAVNLPTNSYLDYSGSNWRCESGFLRQGAACMVENTR